MAIHTLDLELDKVFLDLIKLFPNEFLHGEFLIKKYPEQYVIVDCSGVEVIVWHSIIGDNNCINYCRKSEKERYSNKI